LNVRRVLVLRRNKSSIGTDLDGQTFNKKLPHMEQFQLINVQSKITMYCESYVKSFYVSHIRDKIDSNSFSDAHIS